MARPDLLSSEQIQEQLELHPMWRLSQPDQRPQHIVCELHAADWMAALGIVNAVGILAETMDHHPDIFLYGWNKVRITASTHDCGGLTILDFALASQIDSLPIGQTS